MTSIGVVVSDMYDSYQQTLLKGVKFCCNQNNLKFISFVGGALGHDFASGIGKDSLYSLISDASVDAIVILAGSVSVVSGVEGLSEFVKRLPKVPIVSIGVKIPGVYSVLIDNKSGIADIMDHLILNHNLKDIAFIKGPEANKEASDRFDSYKESLERHNINYNYKLVAPGFFTPGDGIKGLNLILDTRKQKIDSVVCSDDYTAIEVVGALIERGYNVPEDIAVTGFDNLERSSSFSPALTTVSQPIFHIGSLAIKYVIDILKGVSVPNTLFIKTHLMIRESCGCRKTRLFEKGIREADVEFPDFTVLIESITKMVIKINTFSTYNNNFLDYISPEINLIGKSIIKCEKEMTTKYLEQAIEEVLKETYVQNLKGSFWRNILEDFFLSLAAGHYTYEKETFLTLLLNSTLLKLYEVERRISEFRRIDDRTLIQYINRIGDRLLLCRSEDELKKILKDNLTVLRVKNFFIVRFINEQLDAELFFSRNLEDPMDNTKYIFRVNGLLPKNLKSVSSKSFVVYPIMQNDNQVGYILIENGDTPSLIYDFLAEKISYGFKNINIINKIESYTEQLEKAVADRTRELKLANNQLKERSMKDQLTGLNNRRFLEEVIIPKSELLAKKLSNQIRYGNREISTDNVSFAVILIDLDHFKMVNDVYGHASGDTVIKELGKLFGYSIRQEDYIIRLGGEEFLLVLPEFNAEFISNVVEKIRKAVESHLFIMENGETITKTCSLGAMVFPASSPEMIDFKTTISIIDKCLYMAKENGRNKGYVIDVNTDQFRGCPDVGSYIINNFEKCISSKKISIKASDQLS